MDATQTLQTAVREALATRTPLRITGGGSKSFYGAEVTAATSLDVRSHTGLIDYAPSELVVTARCGTPLAELEAALATQGQMLPFEPPHFSSPLRHAGERVAHATVGGMVAAGLSGPRRPWGGAVRDAVLGVTVLNGQGEILKFGGRVMKNVAGYDIARLFAGSLGSLGVILDVSLKVLPRPAKEITLVQNASHAGALTRLTAWQRQSLPLSASLHDGSHLWLRLCGSHAGVNAARDALGGDVLDADMSAGSDTGDQSIWTQVREQTHAFFHTGQPLWRLSVPPATPPFDLPGRCLVDWGGALRWLADTDADPAHLRGVVAAAGGHATLLRGELRGVGRFHPLPPALHVLHQRIKAVFDPQGLFNPGVMYL